MAREVPGRGGPAGLDVPAESGVDQRPGMTRQAGGLARTVPPGRHQPITQPWRGMTVTTAPQARNPAPPGRTGGTRRSCWPGRPVTGMPGFPDDADRDGDVDVLYLAGQLSAGPEWLLITGVDGMPGAEFTARSRRWRARRSWRRRRGAPDHRARAPGAADGPRRGLGRHVRAPVSGRGADRLEPEGWPEKIRATVAFTMGVLTELEEHGADLAAGRRVDLDDAAVTATAGIAADVTSALAGSSGPPGH